MKKSRKSFLLAMMAILVAAGLAGCGRGNSAVEKEMQQEIQQDRQSSRLKVPKSKRISHRQKIQGKKTLLS